MIRTIFSNSGLSLASDNIYYVLDAVKNGLLAMTANDTADTLTLTFREKDNSQDGVETIVLKCEDDKASEAAEDIVSMINGIATNAQVAKVVNLFDRSYRVQDVNWTVAYDAAGSTLDLEVDPDNEPLTDELFTLTYKSLPVSSGPYNYSLYVENVDSTGEDPVTVTTDIVRGTFSADASGKVALTVNAYTGASGAEVAVPATDTGVVNTAYLTVSNPNTGYSVSVTQVISVTHEAA